METCRSIRIEQTGLDTFAANAHAKLNITLRILRMQKNGMHEINSIMQTITMHDRITIERLPKSRGQAFPIVEYTGHVIKGNLVERALRELSAVAGNLQCRIHLSKAIPSCAGLGGGSSDAAAVLRLANAAFGLKLTQEQQCKIAERLGSDVPFFVYGGRAMVEGKNQAHITMLQIPERLYYIVARPDLRLSTGKMYSLHDEKGKDFTALASELCPATERLLACLRTGAVETGVTGKGPTVFAGFRSYAGCMNALAGVEWFKDDLFIERTVS